MSRFGVCSLSTIDKKVKGNVPINTEKAKKTVWNQFTTFCTEREYTLSAETSEAQLANIMKDYAYNMKKMDGEDYKEARDAKRKALQSIPEKRRASAAALEEKDWDAMTTVWDEETPDGLQKKLFMIISVELAWRGGEGSMASIHHFKAEQRNDGETTGRIEYNPIFSKTTQGGDKKLSDSKWLVENREIPDKCPVRLFQKLREKRDANIKSDRLFLTQNPFWNKVPGARWYKDSPVGQNTISKWVKESAQKAGLDLGNKKITNHSSRATAVSNLAKSGLGEQQIIKITGHANSNSIKPYLQPRPGTPRINCQETAKE
ncbi:hypothetical protein NQ317_003022 [Molorchus minor]|uniref:Tyr recombinase domain-containing protein n=1 Tax=Molorchus minor TaxID=1323400 RepID=A0ABQ9IW56_9CUCU|nr:hypothetical protein NQ317_003022 [Molorchus minor]